MTRFFRSRRFGVDDAGAIAVLVAILAPALLAVAAFSVDVARWYVEGVRLQKAADAAALAGVVFMPQDLPTATSTALRVAAMNGFTSGVTVTQGSRPSQLQVTIASRVSNSFAVLMGIPYTTVARTGISDYTGPAPMGSPCNVYGNEPAGSPGAGPTSVLPGTPVNPFCTTSPLYWGNIEGPNTDKVQGDRYMNRTCSSNVDGCTGGVNDEFKPAGYFYIVRVLNPARTGPITLQLYDPAWDYTSVDCSSLPSSMPSNNMNQYATTDAQTRYRNSLNSFCSGDYAPGLGSADPNERVDTSFALRSPAISGNPLDGAPVGNCSAQFKGQTTAPTATQLQQYRTAGSPASGANPLYNQDLSATFHSWFALCTFTPTAAGDYYLQVRTNVALPSALTQTGATKLIACSDTTNALCTVPPNGAVTSQLGAVAVDAGVARRNPGLGRGLRAHGHRHQREQPDDHVQPDPRHPRRGGHVHQVRLLRRRRRILGRHRPGAAAHRRDGHAGQRVDHRVHRFRSGERNPRGVQRHCVAERQQREDPERQRADPVGLLLQLRLAGRVLVPCRDPLLAGHRRHHVDRHDPGRPRPPRQVVRPAPTRPSTAPCGR